jgi:hypothetical protein
MTKYFFGGGQMKKLLLATSLIIAALAPSAHAAPVEVLIVVLDQSGVKSLHKQTLPNGECRKFLVMLRENIRGGKLPVVLTLHDPEATGEVISAHCVLPDGKVETVGLLPPTTDGCAVVLKTPDGFLNMRKAPTMKSPVLAKLHRGDRVTYDAGRDV